VTEQRERKFVKMYYEKCYGKFLTHSMLRGGVVGGRRDRKKERKKTKLLIKFQWGGKGLTRRDNLN